MVAVPVPLAMLIVAVPLDPSPKMNLALRVDEMKVVG
jgi:hypothetical protein